MLQSAQMYGIESSFISCFLSYYFYLRLRNKGNFVENQCWTMRIQVFEKANLTTFMLGYYYYNLDRLSS